MVTRVALVLMVVLAGTAFAGDSPAVVVDYGMGLSLAGSEVSPYSLPVSGAVRVTLVRVYESGFQPFFRVGVRDEQYGSRWDEPEPGVPHIPFDDARSGIYRGSPVGLRAAFYEVSAGVRWDGARSTTRRYAEVALDAAHIDHGPIDADLGISFGAGVGWRLSEQVTLWVGGEERVYLTGRYALAGALVRIECGL